MQSDAAKTWTRSSPTCYATPTATRPDKAHTGGLHRSPAARHPDRATAALALEVISPGDDTWQKLPFYAAHHVNELLILDPATRTIHWLSLTSGRYQPTDHSALIDLGPAGLAHLIDWP